MTFTNPLLLAGLAGAVLPVVLHLLGRARARRVPWGAAMLLSPSPGEAALGRLRDTLLLAVRCGAIALLAVTLARPKWPSAAAVEASAAVVVVLDASPSMTHPEANTTRFELARRAALDRLAQLQSGDQAGLVVLGVVPPADVPLTPDLQAVASQLVSLVPGGEPADQADGAARAKAMLADAGVDGGEVLLVGDRHRAAWASLRSPAADAEPGPRVVAVPVGSTRNDNAWIESVELQNPPAVVGVPARVVVRLRNDGDAPHGALGLSVFPGQDAPPREPVAIDAHGRARVVRTITPARAGPAVLTATIDPTGLPGDDTFRRAIDVVPPIRVRVLTTRPAATVPSTTNGAAVPWVPDGGALDVAFGPSTSDLSRAKVGVVVLNDILPDPAAVAELERFVAGGGGLVVAPGPTVTRAAWNERLWKNGTGLAPAALDLVTPPAAQRPGGAWPVILPAADATDWLAAGVTRHWRLVAAGPGSIVCRVGRDALIVERAFGRGRVVAAAVPLDGRWTDGAGGGVYAGLVEALVRRAVDRPAGRNVDAGVPLETTVPRSRDRGATVLRPDGQIDRVNLGNAGDSMTFRYGRTDLPGRYVVRIGDRPATDWVVRTDAEESNLALLDDAALSDLLRPAAVTLRTETPPPARRTEWGKVGLAGVALLLATDVVIAATMLPRRGRS